MNCVRCMWHLHDHHHVAAIRDSPYGITVALTSHQTSGFRHCPNCRWRYRTTTTTGELPGQLTLIQGAA